MSESLDHFDIFAISVFGKSYFELEDQIECDISQILKYSYSTITQALTDLLHLISGQQVCRE